MKIFALRINMQAFDRSLLQLIWTVGLLFAPLLTPQSLFADSCSFVLRDFKASSPSLSRMKANLLQAAMNPKIQMRTLKTNSKGADVEFLHPLVHDIFNKAIAELSEIFGATDPKINSFEEVRKSFLKHLQAGELTYSEIYSIPFVISEYFSIEAPTEIFITSARSRQWQLENFVKLGVYPLPIFFSPNFEMRVMLVAMKTPPISMSAKKIPSYLDLIDISPVGSPHHDAGHVYVRLLYLKDSISKYVNKSALASDQDRQEDRMISSRVQLIGKLELAILEAARKMKVGKEIAFFFLNQLAVEINFYGARSDGKSYSAVLVNWLPRHYEQLIWRFTAETGLSTGSLPAFSGDEFRKVLNDLRLYNVELEIEPGRKTKIYYSTDRPESAFLSGDRKDMFLYLKRLEKEIVPLFRDVILSHSQELDNHP